MKRDFLKNLGIEDKDLIDKILDENSTDIGRAKAELDTYKNKVTDLENDLKAKNTRIEELEKSTTDVKALQDKVTQLEADKAKLTSDLDTKVTALQKTHAIENGVRDAKARNSKAVIAQLDMEKITFENGVLSGLTEQLESLKTGEDTSFLFGESTPRAPAGTHPSNPPSTGNPKANGGSFADAIQNAISNQNKSK